MAEKIDPAREAPSPEQGEMTEAEIDEVLIESFPASDPPPWTLGTDPHPHDDEDEVNDPKEDPARAAPGGK